MVSNAVKSAAGRPQESTLTGPGYALAEYLNKAWDSKVSATNQELAQEWNYRSPGIISMWRTGKSRVPIERLPDLARLLGVDLAVLLPLWLEQYTAAERKGKAQPEIEKVFKRVATVNENNLLRTMRNVAKFKGVKDPEYTPRQLQAIEQVLVSDTFTDFVLEEAKRQSMIEEIEPADAD